MELILVEDIAVYHKNLLAFCDCWQTGRTVAEVSLYGTLDMIQLSMASLEALVEDRRRA